MYRARRVVLTLLFALAGCGGNTSRPPPLSFGNLEAGSDAAVDGRAHDAAPDQAQPPIDRPSCRNGGPGAGSDCGHDQNQYCCASAVVIGGNFDAFWTPLSPQGEKLPATISSFRLDRFEVTVGRFRAFVEAYPGSRPALGAGANPHVPGSGWQAGWPLPTTAAELRVDLKSCDKPTWTDGPGPNERRPINCVDWYELFAFCAWDHGRLPTAVERNYAAVGGAEERVYPWSVPFDDSAIDSAHAVYSNDYTQPDYAQPEPVGSRPSGKGRWGQYDLAGNVYDWELDESLPAFPCADCANLHGPAGELGRFDAGGAWNRAPQMAQGWEYSSNASNRHDSNVGGRCVVIE